MRIFMILILLLMIAGCAKREDSVVIQPSESLVTVNFGTHVQAKIVPVTLANGTRCVVVTTTTGGNVSIDCHFQTGEY